MIEQKKNEVHHVVLCGAPKRDGGACQRSVAEAGKRCPFHALGDAEASRLASEMGAASARKFARRTTHPVRRKRVDVRSLRTADEIVDCVERLIALVLAGQAGARELTAVTGACKFLAELRGLAGAPQSPEDFLEGLRQTLKPGPGKRWNPGQIYADDGEATSVNEG